MREDSILYTGASSAAFGSTKQAQVVATKRAESAEVKQDKQIKLKPVAELVKGEIQKELTAIRNLDTLDVTQDPQKLQAELYGREIAKQRLLNFQNNLLKALR